MNKKDYILLLLCMMPIIVFAQKKSSIKPTNYRVEKLIPGTDTYVTEYMRSVEDAGIMNLQESVTFIDANDKKRTFTPDSMITFYIKKEAYTAFTFEFKGKTQKAFLFRYMNDIESGLKMFMYFEAPNKPNYYCQKGNDPTLYPAFDNPSKGYISPMHSYLRELAGDKADEFEEHIDGERMGPEMFMKLKRLIKAKNLDIKQRTRFGFVIASEYSKIQMSDYEFNSSALFSAGVFADIPVDYDITIHPELLVSKYGLNGTKKDLQTNTVAYNTTALSLPIMIRYTFNHLAGKYTPYIQFGYQPTLMVSSKLEYRYLVNNMESPIPDYDDTKYTSIVTDTDDNISNHYSNLIGGVGVGYSILPKHSIFIDVRARLGIARHRHTGIMLSLSYNL